MIKKKKNYTFSRNSKSEMYLMLLYHTNIITFLDFEQNEESIDLTMIWMCTYIICVCGHYFDQKDCLAHCNRKQFLIGNVVLFSTTLLIRKRL